jgi:hypothetical protein
MSARPEVAVIVPRLARVWEAQGRWLPIPARTGSKRSTSSGRAPDPAVASCSPLRTHESYEASLFGVVIGSVTNGLVDRIRGRIGQVGVEDNVLGTCA